MAPNKRGRWSSPRGRPAASRGRFRDFNSAPGTPPTMRVPSNGFSLRDEARHTASHQSSLAWTSGDAKLRQKPVTFVSAGVIEPLKEEKPPDDPSDSPMPEEAGEDGLAPVSDASEAKSTENPDTEIMEAFKVETTVETIEQETRIIEQALPEQSAGDSDQPLTAEAAETNELFFYDLGEDEPAMDPTIPPPKIPSPRSSFGGSDSSEEVILFRGRSANARGSAHSSGLDRINIITAPPQEAIKPKPETTTMVSDTQPPESIGSPSKPPGKRSKSRRRRSRAPKTVQDEDEDAILADYIANMAADSDIDSFANQLTAFSGHRDLGGDDFAVNFGSGHEKSPKDDDSFAEEKEESMESGVSDAEGADSDGGMDADMDDEVLAQLLAKQEELGMGSDELLLFSSSFAQTGSRKARGKRPARGLRQPASATQVADALDNLDLADWSQLTGQSRKRRSKQAPNFNVSDSEIEAALKTAWQRDRERKKGRKLEREALRAEGLLGKHANPDDLRVKYQTGMKLDDIKTELTSFLLDSAERLDFPPLDKHARKVLHELANKFNIKSQSTGKGDQRRPVLYRTNRTVRYATTKFEDAASHVNQAALRIHRKYFHRVDVKVQRTETPRNAGAGRVHKALTFQEGEIVGASVPELGQENKGRNMLEKMGWSKGMALGALDNKGILEPVTQVMKRSKAGLG